MSLFKPLVFDVLIVLLAVVNVPQKDQSHFVFHSLGIPRVPSQLSRNQTFVFLDLRGEDFHRVSSDSVVTYIDVPHVVVVKCPTGKRLYKGLPKLVPS